MQKFLKFIEANKTEIIVLVLILSIAAFLRFYKIDQYMTFLGDEGRDMLVIKKMLTKLDLPFIGPPTSIGNMYLGPLYYYMMAPPLTIFWLNPVAASSMVALIGVLTVGFIYYTSRVWFGKIAGLLSAFLYSISPVTIFYSRSSWNPNPAPFFALLMIFSLFKTHTTRNFKWLILTGISLAFTIQMHYLALILMPIAVLFWLYELLLFKRKNLESRLFWSGTILAVVLFLALMSPLVMFDLKHDFINYKAISSFFSQRETTVNLNPLHTLERILPIYSQNLIGRYVSGEHPILTPLISILILGSFLGLIKFKKTSLKWPYSVLLVWLTFGILGLALYKQTIFDHYLGFLNPVPFIMFGSLASLIQIPRYKILTALLMVIMVTLTFSLAVINLQKSPLLKEPNNQLKRTQDAARFVISEADGKPFNFALIAEHNYDSAYQFYLDFYGHKPKTVPMETTDQLFVVCEDQICKPVGHPKQEIAAFGWTLIEKETEFNGIKVFKLIHNPKDPSRK